MASSGGVVSYSVNPSTSALSFLDALTLPFLESVDGPAHLEQTRFGGQDYIVNLGRHADGLEAVQIGTGGDLDTRVDLAGTDGSGISALVFHSAETRDVAYASYWGSSDLGIYQVNTAGAMSLLGTRTFLFSPRKSRTQCSATRLTLMVDLLLRMFCA